MKILPLLSHTKSSGMRVLVGDTQKMWDLTKWVRCFPEKGRCATIMYMWDGDTQVAYAGVVDRFIDASLPFTTITSTTTATARFVGLYC